MFGEDAVSEDERAPGAPRIPLRLRRQFSAGSTSGRPEPGPNSASYIDGKDAAPRLSGHVTDASRIASSRNDEQASSSPSQASTTGPESRRVDAQLQDAAAPRAAHSTDPRARTRVPKRLAAAIGQDAASRRAEQTAPSSTPASAPSGTPVVPPRFIPQLDRELLRREDQRHLRLEAERIARSSSKDVLPSDAESSLDREARATRRARRRFRNRILLAGAILAVLAFIVGAIVNPFAKRTPSPDELAASNLAHPTPTGVPYAALEPGQCLSSFTNAWAAEWQTTECTSEHAAQFLAEVPADPFTGKAYPGEQSLRSRAQLSCQAKSVLDEQKAKSVTSLVIDVRYAATQAEWDAGLQSYACFAARSDGGSWRGSLAP